MRTIIAFTGPKGSGKTTAADVWVELYGFKKLSLAAPIKEFFHDVFELNTADPQSFYNKDHSLITLEWYGPVATSRPRKFMQLAGDFAKKMALSTNVFVDYLICKIKPGENIVIDDLRYPFEAKRLRESFLHTPINIIEINRPGFEASDEHSSENSFKEIPKDMIIHNTGSLEDFKRLTKDTYRCLIRRGEN